MSLARAPRGDDMVMSLSEEHRTRLGLATAALGDNHQPRRAKPTTLFAAYGAVVEACMTRLPVAVAQAVADAFKLCNPAVAHWLVTAAVLDQRVHAPGPLLLRALSTLVEGGDNSVCHATLVAAMASRQSEWLASPHTLQALAPLLSLSGLDALTVVLRGASGLPCPPLSLKGFGPWPVGVQARVQAQMQADDAAATDSHARFDAALAHGGRLGWHKPEHVALIGAAAPLPMFPPAAAGVEGEGDEVDEAEEGLQRVMEGAAAGGAGAGGVHPVATPHKRCKAAAARSPVAMQQATVPACPLPMELKHAWVTAALRRGGGHGEVVRFITRASEQATRLSFPLHPLLHACVSHAKWSDAVAVVGPELDRRHAFVEYLATHQGDAKQAGRFVRSLGLDMDAFPTLRRDLKANALAGLLRIAARDLVVTHTTMDEEADGAVRGYVSTRVADGRTTPAVAEAWNADFTACQAAVRSGDVAAVEEALARLDVSTDALFRKGGVARATVTGATGEEAGNGTLAAAVVVGDTVIAQPRHPSTAYAHTQYHTLPSGAATDVLSACHLPFLAHDAYGYLRLPSFATVEPVNTLHQLHQVAATVYGVQGEGHDPWRPPKGYAVHGEPVVFLGIDCEWVTPLLSDGSPQCSIFTVSVGTVTWLLDLPALHAWCKDDPTRQSQVDAAMGALFLSSPGTRPRTIVLVYGGSTDFAVIHKTYPYLRTFAATAPAAIDTWPLTRCWSRGARSNGTTGGKSAAPFRGIEYVDLMSLSQMSEMKVSGGLAALTKACLGYGLNKYWQMSDWNRRPLTAGQQEYAALDAFVLAPILFLLGPQAPKVPGATTTETATEDIQV